MFDIHMSLKQNKNMKNANFMFIGTYYLVFMLNSYFIDSS